jgi:hypothetical protein
MSKAEDASSKYEKQLDPKINEHNVDPFGTKRPIHMSMLPIPYSDEKASQINPTEKYQPAIYCTNVSLNILISAVNIWKMHLRTATGTLITPAVLRQVCADDKSKIDAMVAAFQILLKATNHRLSDRNAQDQIIFMTSNTTKTCCVSVNGMIQTFEDTYGLGIDLSAHFAKPVSMGHVVKSIL